jgi:DNA-nicking Smr family endonuclease
MATSLKNFADLQALQKQLAVEAELRAEKERERLDQEREMEREASLFRTSVGNVQPLSVEERVLIDAPRPLPVARHRLADEQAALEESLSDEFSVETLMESDEELSFARNGVGQDVLRKLRRGAWVIQEQLDLHGLRTDEAREAVALFLRHALRKGYRCVRIIHGKGLGSANKEPVLKKKVRNWLVQKEEVMAFCQARAAEGGSGALVVLLRG